MTGTRIAYDESSAVTGLSVAPRFQFVRPWQSLSMGGTVTRFPDDVWSIQGHFAGSTFLPALVGLHPEVSVRMLGTRHEDGGGSSDLAGALRFHWIRGTRGFWAGANGGRAWDGQAWHGTVAAEAGGWTRSGPGTLSLALSGTRLGSGLRFAESEAAYRVERGALELVAYGGFRHWLRPGDADAEGWGGASVAWWIGKQLALTATGGAYPADYAQGLPSGAYGSVGLRLATGRLTRGRQASEPLDLIIPPPGTARITLDRLAEGTARLVLNGVPGFRVEIMGDFTLWEPIPLAPLGGGRWSTVLPISEGIHRMNLRVDGGEWRVPPGLPSSDDEFGGSAGLLVVE